MIKRFAFFLTLSISSQLLISCGGNDEPAGPIPVIESFTPENGPVGTTITLSGLNFSSNLADNEIYFNGKQAQILTTTTTTITTKVPVDATTGKITIKVKGVSGVSSKDYTVTIPTWLQKKGLSGFGRQYGVGFSVGNLGYVCLGESVSTYFKDLWEYNPTEDTWTQKADFGGVGRSGSAGFAIGSKGYVGTGYDGNGNKFKDFWEYNPSTNQWSQKADFAGTARYMAVGFSIGNLGYIGTGDDYPASSGESKDFWEYNPTTNAWTKKADFGGAIRSAAVGFSIGTKGYIGTGYLVGGTMAKDFWEYNQSNDSWIQKADFGGDAREEAVAFAVNGKGYVGTGAINPYSDGNKDFWKFDPVTNNWVRVTDFFGGKTILFGSEDGTRRGAVSFVIGLKAYVGTGSGIIHSRSDFWEYTPE